MSKEEIIIQANLLGINVSKETFNLTYELNPNNKLLSNACMSKNCPYFLIPINNFTSHNERM